MIHDISFYNLDGCDLELPTTFEDCLSPEQQIIWLFLHKQDLLEAGDGVTLTPLPDGNVRISVEGGTGGSEYTMVKVAHPSAGNIAEYRLRDVTAGSYKGDIIEIPEGEQGKDGVGITSIVFKSEDIDGNYIYTVNLSDNTHYDITAPRGPEGERGARGSQGPAGQDGTDGTDGVSPTISVTQITGGHEVEITDAQGTTSFDVMDGVDGTDGTNGTDGVSPTVTVTAITGGHEVSITDAQGTDTFNVMDGTNGTNGTDGVSPSVTVTQITGGHQVSITDAQGTDTFNVMDGQDGEGNRIWYTLSNYEPWSVPNYTFNISDLTGVSGETPIAGDYVIQYYNSRTVLYYINAVGSTTVACRSICDLTGAPGQNGTNGTDGVSPTITVTSITGGHQISITDAQGTNTFNVMDGVDGQNGTNGTDGVSPTVTVTAITGGHEVSITDAQGTDTFNVMDGQQGPAGQNGTNGTDGVSPSVTVTPITGGHEVSITDAQGTDTFNVMDGVDGQQGQTGPAGPGVPTGGTAGQVLSKVDGTDYNTQWTNPASGGMNTDGSNAASTVTFNSKFTVGSVYQYSTPGNNSVSIGINNDPKGDRSFAQGSYCTVHKSNAHAEGYYCQAGRSQGATTNTEACHAEGYQNQASYDGAHAEGKWTEANNYGAHAEGVGFANSNAGRNIATGEGSHSEGCGTYAYGRGSHAEGVGDSSTKVRSRGEASHAEGYKTTAHGNYSHAEGNQTIAGVSGSETTITACHAEGTSTTASGNSSHAEGYSSQAIGDYSHAGGESGIASQKDQFAFGGLGIGEYKKLGFGFGCGLNISVDMGVVPPISSSEYVPFNKVIDARYGGGGLLHSNDNPQSSGDDKFYAFELEKYGVYLLTLVRMVTTPSYPALPANTSSLKSFAILIGRGSSQQVLIEGSDFSANQYRWKVQYDQVGGVGDVYNKRLFYIAINEPDVDSSTGNQMAYHFQLLRLI